MLGPEKNGGSSILQEQPMKNLLSFQTVSPACFVCFNCLVSVDYRDHEGGLALDRDVLSLVSQAQEEKSLHGNFNDINWIVRGKEKKKTVDKLSPQDERHM